MNRSFKSVFNRRTGTWQVVSEKVRNAGKTGGSTSLPALAIRMVAAGMISGLFSPQAQALCTTDGSTVSCTGVTVGLVSSTSNLTANVQNGAQIFPGVVDQINSVSLTGTGVTVNNGGRIDPSLLPDLVSLASGLNISNNAGSTVTVNNLASGQIMGTSTLLGANLLNLGGVGLVVQNGAGGTTTVNNSGLISGTPLLGASILAEDIAVIALRGGARNMLTNNAGGIITGRVAMQASTLGNTFTNAGTVTGSINLGAGLGANTFNAVTGSLVSGGAGVGIDLGVLGGLGIAYVPTGIVNGGTLNNGNTLNLMNAIGGGSGINGAGTINGTQYVNFNNLVVNSGTWTLTNPLFKSGTTSPVVNLNGGQLNVDSSALNLASITANGGSLGAAVAGATVSNGITLGSGGLVVNNAANSLTLSGVLTGSGDLTKVGTGNLILSGANNFIGTTTMAAGTLTLGNALALGGSSNTLNVTGASTLSSTLGMTVANGVLLNGANLTVNSDSALNLSGAINGTGSLTKTGSANLTLSGANNFGGGLNINAGRLILANAGAAGAGTITAGIGGTAALDTSTAQTLTNLVQLNGNLTLTGSNDLALNGKISGTGGLIKSGSNALILSGANDFTGNSTLGGGILVLTNNTALGDGQLTLTANSSLLADGLTVGNAINVSSRTLTLSNLAATTLSGVLSGSGAIIKNGAGELTLSGANTFGGVLSLASGKLIVGSNTALGNGALTVSGQSALGSTTAITLNNDVALNAQLTVLVNSDMKLNGSLSGSGELIKQGTGTLMLSGVNTYTGATTVSAGTLNLSGTGSIANSSLTTVQYGATLSGSGTLGNTRVESGGHLAPNRSIGTLDISGDLALDQDSFLNLNLGESGTSVDPATGISGRLAVTGDLALDGIINLAQSSDPADGTAGIGYYRLLTYGGDLTSNTATIGSTPALTDVTYKLETGANRVDLFIDTAAILGNDALQHWQGGDGAWDTGNTQWLNAGGDTPAGWAGHHAVFRNAPGNFSGGTVTVNGAQHFEGIQFVDDGYALIGSGTLETDPAGSEIRVLADSATIATTIAGSGGITKSEAGTLLLTGNNSYTGNTTVAAGTLDVSGSIAHSAVTIRSGATLAGSGTVGTTTVQSGGSIALGNAISTLTVNGDLTFSANSSYQVKANADGDSDRIDVTGTAHLAGNVVSLAANTGTYQANTTYTILQAGALSGQFDAVSSSLAFLDASVSQDDRNVYLQLSRNDVAYADVGHTRNQRSVATALQNAASSGNADMNTVITAINNLSADQARAAYDSIGGAGLTGMQRVGIGFSNNFGNQLMGRLQTVGMSRTAQSINGMQLAANARLNDLMPALAQNTRSDVSPSSFTLGGGVPVDDGRRGFWLRGFGSDQDTDGDGNAAGLRVRSAGVSAGFDARVRDDLVVGAAFSYSDSDVRASFAETGKSRGNAAAVYASYANGPWTFNGNLMLTHNSNEMDRNITVGTLNRTAQARFDSKTVSAYGEASYDLPQASWTLQPLAGLAVLHNRNDGFTETGAGALNIQADAQSVTSTRTLFGARALFDLDGISVQPRATWAHEFGDVNKGMTAQFQGAPAASFTTFGVDLPRDSLIAGLTVAGRTSDGLSLFADVQGEFNSRQTGLSLLVGLRKSW